ncbi:MAG: hypothetical protein WKF30_13245 [Pyrinomonadaceae bacterium]
MFGAFIYNVLGVPLAAGALYPLFGILLSPIIAGAAMAASSITVVTNVLTNVVVELAPFQLGGLFLLLDGVTGLDPGVEASVKRMHAFPAMLCKYLRRTGA